MKITFKKNKNEKTYELIPKIRMKITFKKIENGLN